MRRTIYIVAGVLFASVATAQEETNEKPEEQVFACLIEKVAGIDEKGAGSRKPAHDRFILRYTPHYIEGNKPHRAINKATVQAAVDGGEPTEYVDVFMNWSFVHESRVFETAMRDVETGLGDDVRGYYSRQLVGEHIWIKGADEHFSGGRLKEGGRLKLSIVQHNEDWGYVSSGFCERF